MNPQIHAAILLYIIWLYFNFRRLGNICIYDIKDTIIKPYVWTWEPLVLAGPALIVFAVRKLYIQNQLGMKQNIVLFSLFMLYIMFIFKMVFSCKQNAYEYMFFMICIILGIILLVELQANYSGTSKLARKSNINKVI